MRREAFVNADIGNGDVVSVRIRLPFCVIVPVPFVDHEPDEGMVGVDFRTRDGNTTEQVTTGIKRDSLMGNRIHAAIEECHYRKLPSPDSMEVYVWNGEKSKFEQ